MHSMELWVRNGRGGREKFLSIFILMLSSVKNLHILKFGSNSCFHELLGKKGF